MRLCDDGGIREDKWSELGVRTEVVFAFAWCFTPEP
jgi:hypothetical protein